MIWILLACSIAMAYVDYRAIGRLCRTSAHRRGWLVALWTLDALPALSWLFALVISRDNPTWISMVMLWANWAYMMLVIARAPLMISIAVWRRGWIRAVGAVTSVVIMVIFVYGTICTRTDYEVRSVMITSSRLPKAFDGYRIVQISDMHIGTMLDAEREVGQIVDICNSLDADAVFFTGDLVDIRYSEITPAIAQQLSRLRSRDGLFSVTGNHDLGVYIRDSISLSPDENVARLIAAQQRMGWHVMDDRSEYVVRGSDSIAITGIAFSQELQEHRHSSHIPDIDIDRLYANQPDSLFNITLSHIPQLWDMILAGRYADLTLSGHVHAMQMKLPIGKRGLSPSRVKYKRWSGLYEEQGRWLYINDGLGCVAYPMRIGARPEITLIELHSSR